MSIHLHSCSFILMWYYFSLIIMTVQLSPLQSEVTWYFRQIHLSQFLTVSHLKEIVMVSYDVGLLKLPLNVTPFISSLFLVAVRTHLRLFPHLPLLIPPPCLVHPPALSRTSILIHLPPPHLQRQLTLTWSPAISARSPWPPYPSTTDRWMTPASSGSAWSSATMATCTRAYW